MGSDDASNDVLSEGGVGEKQTPIINIKNVTIMDYECPLITFNVTDSNSNLISGDVVVTVFDDYDEDISKYVFVFSGEGIDSFKDFDLKRLDEFEAKKGKYKVLVNFAGDTMYNKISKKFTLRIK